jgi:hypothetical protein
MIYLVYEKPVKCAPRDPKLMIARMMFGKLRVTYLSGMKLSIL